MKTFKSIGVVGGGTMGAGIAQIAALAGLRTVLYDLNPDILEQAKARITTSVKKGIERQKLPPDALAQVEGVLVTTQHFDDLVHNLDLVIEAVPEDLQLKLNLFSKLDTLCPPETCFASNTSSISITTMGAATKRPQKLAGMHFFNPVPQMKLVEVIHGKETEPQLIDQLCVLAETLGKTPVKVKDTPGFIVNRVARAFYGEALRLVDEGAVDVSTIDALMREEGGFPMGPFELMDLIGIDVNYAVTQSVYHAYFEEPRFKPHPIQRQMVEAGHLGRKTGRGFYTYDN
jgi:3-hydroxybutyryl-CoA dehydrogenase